MKVFFDSSALAKRYLEETGSEEVEKICFKAEAVILSILCVPEIISAFARLRRENKLSIQQFTELKRVFLVEIEDTQLINISSVIIKHSVELLEQYSVRTLDALHIACAGAVEVDLFVTADRRQMDAANALGFAVHLV